MGGIEKDTILSLQAALEAKEATKEILVKKLKDADNILRQCHNMFAGVNALMPEKEIELRLKTPTSCIERQIIHWRKNLGL